MEYPLKNLWYKISSWHVKEQQRSLSLARQRAFAISIMAWLAYGIVFIRLCNVMIWQLRKNSSDYVSTSLHSRNNIIDRNGVILATQLVTASVYSNPKLLLDPAAAAAKLQKIFPYYTYEQLLGKLCTNRSFIWIERHITPKMQHAINNLGIPGVYLKQDQKRVYPHGQLFCHVLGQCDVDSVGVSGIEKYFDERLIKGSEDLQLSLDLRVQHVVHSELLEALKKFQAVAGNAIVMDAHTGEILASVSLPGFDSNKPLISNNNRFNRNTLGVYEQGSTFKILNVAIALESKVAHLNSLFDATNPIKIGRFMVTDFKGKNRVLSLSEAFVYSSNIAAIQIAKSFGSKVQQQYMKKFGILDPVKLEIPENGYPIVPKDWRDVTMMTVSYGYGISVTPLQTLVSVTGIVNNGNKPSPTLLYVPTSKYQERCESFKRNPIVSPNTSKIVRYLMRLVASEGTAKKANVEGYQVFCKTGTAYQVKGKGYGGGEKSRTTSFIGGFPYDNMRYMMIIMLDDPKATKETYGYATAGWNAADVAGRIIKRVAPILGVRPSLMEKANQECQVSWIHTKLDQ